MVSFILRDLKEPLFDCGLYNYVRAVQYGITQSHYHLFAMLEKYNPNSYTLISEASVVTSEMRELLVQLAPTIMGVTSAPPLSSESGPTIIVETAKPVLIVDILKDLILRMIDQIFSMMTYCTELVLSGRTSFELMWPLLENHVENI